MQDSSHTIYLVSHFSGKRRRQRREAGTALPETKQNTSLEIAVRLKRIAVCIHQSSHVQTIAVAYNFAFNYVQGKNP